MTDWTRRASRALVRNLALLLIALTAVSLNAAAQTTPPQAQAYFTEPAISPDGSEIAFVSGGDIWTAPANGGEARLLVSHPANESRPLYSPDGRRLAFISTRTGNGDIYVLTLDTGDLKRLTFDDSNDQLDAWSADGSWISVSSVVSNLELDWAFGWCLGLVSCFRRFQKNDPRNHTKPH